MFIINEKTQPIEKKGKYYELEIYIWGKSNIYETYENILNLTGGKRAMKIKWYAFGRKLTIFEK